MLKNKRIFRLTLLGIAILEMLSWIAWSTQSLNQIFLAVILLITLLIALYKLEWGIYIILTELIIGSKGYLLHWPLGDFAISLRLGLFLIVFLAYLIWLIRERKIKFFQTKLWKPYSAFMIAMMIALGIGYLNNNELKNIFLDWNGYLYLGLIFPLTQCINIKNIPHTIYVLFASGTALIIKTIALLFIFSQGNFFGIIRQAVYKWVRDTGVGEITLMPNGFYRIFMQSHIYLIIIFFITFSIIILYQKLEFKKILILILILLLTFIIDYGIILGIVNFPMPGHTIISASSLVTERTKNPTQEAAGSSRMELLKPLFKKNLENAIAGAGFGTTISYQTKDPRALENNPDGWYTTYAFEWGYLDLWLKLGLWGLIIYGWLLWEIFKSGFKKFQSTKNPVILGSLLGFCVILIIHVFTPYLNHPLGLGWIMLCSIYFTTRTPSTIANEE